MTETKPSKSARKRAYLALQQLGEELITLRDADLRTVPLDDDLLGAVLEARGITKRGALRRQKQYIGKLMGRLDDPGPIRQAIERLRRR